jgi:hypothetical protein
MGVTRRRVVVGGALAAASVAGLGVWSMSSVIRFATVADARRAVMALAEQPPHLTGAWSLAQVLSHAAQSIEYSLDGFPQLKPALFRATAGALAFKVFDARGAMRHPLDQAIPGAPTLPSDTPLPAAVQRLLTAFDRFERHTGPLQPHFAYGTLDKDAYTRAHLMHLANHWAEFGAAATPT